MKTGFQMSAGFAFMLSLYGGMILPECQAKSNFPPLGKEPLAFESVYQPLTIVMEGGVVVMKSERKGRLWKYSGVYLKDPKEIAVPYQRHFFLLPVFKDNPSRILLIGLGGGGINALINASYPEAVMESAEIDPLVLDLARHYMGFNPGPNNQVHLQDGRMVVKRSKERYDWVILDAFRGGDIPAHLKTREFYQEIRDKLTADGLVATNLIEGNELFDADVATLRASFAQVVFFKVAESRNVVAIAAPFAKPVLGERLSGLRADSINPSVMSYVRVLELAQRLIIPPVTKALVLTDDFAPVEFLNIKKTD